MIELILTIAAGILLWSFLGLIFIAIIFVDTGETLFKADGFEFVNPIYIYKNSKVNIFGAIIVSIFMSLICPIGTIIYWFYKLCTFG